MRILLLCVLAVLLWPRSEERLLVQIRSRWRPQQRRRTDDTEMQNLKRHSDGTFSSDFTQHLDKLKARNFVQWLATSKKDGCHEEVFHFAAEI
ncbi:glucagon-1-like [Synchiropus splendidus]|uniref:glucagon-1-like n=1 Tax=Synchiropus splendidus TaxID=270530 RepID=UPI00237D5621|nr:glucagon-1-like [Synchiropus splendidus]